MTVETADWSVQEGPAIAKQNFWPALSPLEFSENLKSPRPKFWLTEEVEELDRISIQPCEIIPIEFRQSAYFVLYFAEI